MLSFFVILVSFFSRAKTDWTADVVAQVNALRATHQAPPVVWNTALESYANTWATHLASQNTGLFHSAGPYGENIAEFGGGCAGGPGNCTRDAVNLWYAEGANYTYGVNSAIASLHFTQVVWVSTTSIGAAYVASASPVRYYVVMEFLPPGNYIGQFANNVLPPASPYPSPSPSPSPSPPYSFPDPSSPSPYYPSPSPSPHPSPPYSFPDPSSPPPYPSLSPSSASSPPNHTPSPSPYPSPYPPFPSPPKSSGITRVDNRTLILTFLFAFALGVHIVNGPPPW